MKSIILSAIFLTLSFSAYSQTTPTKSSTKKVSKVKKIKVKVVNKEDPICHMKTSEFLKDTLKYNKKIYGFCNTHCKEVFKENPEKYLK